MLKPLLFSAFLLAAPSCASDKAPAGPQPDAAGKVVIVGDSIALGLGAMGPDTDCPVTPEYNSVDKSFGVQVANALGADYEMFAWPGAGLVHNYGSDQTSTVSILMNKPAQLDRLEATGPVRLVLVNIGTHDFHQYDPTDAFIPAMEDLLTSLAERYPDAIVYALTGPMLGGKEAAFHDQAVRTAVAKVNKAHGTHIRYLALNGGDRTVAHGCAWHPSVPAHTHMAEMILEDLRTHK